MIPEAGIHPLASRELEEAALFYDQRVPRLGERLLNEVRKAAELILPVSCIRETARMEAEPILASVWSFRSHCFWISPWEGSSGCGMTCTETRVAKRPQGK